MVAKNLGYRPVALENSNSFTGTISVFRMYLKEILFAVLDFQNALIAALRHNKRNKTKGLKINL